jgi:hypothetical protein
VVEAAHRTGVAHGAIGGRDDLGVVGDVEVEAAARERGPGALVLEAAEAARDGAGDGARERAGRGERSASMRATAAWRSAASSASCAASARSRASRRRAVARLRATAVRRSGVTLSGEPAPRSSLYAARARAARVASASARLASTCCSAFTAESCCASRSVLSVSSAWATPMVHSAARRQSRASDTFGS